MRCQYPGCHKREPQYFICWDETNPDNKIRQRGCGYVCAQHDKVIGRTNLVKCGMSLDEAIEWESANKLTSESGLDKRPTMS